MPSVYAEVPVGPEVDVLKVAEILTRIEGSVKKAVLLVWFDTEDSGPTPDELRRSGADYVDMR